MPQNSTNHHYINRLAIISRNSPAKNFAKIISKSLKTKCFSHIFIICFPVKYGDKKGSISDPVLNIFQRKAGNTSVLL